MYTKNHSKAECGQFSKRVVKRCLESRDKGIQHLAGSMRADKCFRDYQAPKTSLSVNWIMIITVIVITAASTYRTYHMPGPVLRILYESTQWICTIFFQVDTIIPLILESRLSNLPKVTYKWQYDWVPIKQCLKGQVTVLDLTCSSLSSCFIFPNGLKLPDSRTESSSALCSLEYLGGLYI